MQRIEQSDQHIEREHYHRRLSGTAASHAPPGLCQVLVAARIPDHRQCQAQQQVNQSVRPQYDRLIRHVSVQPHARIGDRVGNIGQQQTKYVQHRTQEDHGTHNREILAVDCIDCVAAQARNAEERLGEQTADEEQWQYHDHTGQDRDQRISQNMAEQHQVLGNTPARADRT